MRVAPRDEVTRPGFDTSVSVWPHDWDSVTGTVLAVWKQYLPLTVLNNRLFSLGMTESDSEALRDGLAEIESLSSDLNLCSGTEEAAKALYHNAFHTEECSFVGRGVSAIVAACVLVACRETGDVRTTEEIAAKSPEHINEKRIHKTTKYLSTTLSLGLVVANPDDFVERIGDQLDADVSDVNLAKEVVSVLESDGAVMNQAARTIAATAFYYVGAHDRGHGRYTQEDVADAVNISTLTVRTNYRDYSDVLSQYNITELSV